VGDLGLDAGLVENGAEVLSMSTPSQARRTKIIDGDTKARVAELVRALREDDKAL
jgi:electron transfer flavoprotein alpha/beta subunit